MAEIHYIWQGTYPCFADAAQDAVGPGFSGPIYCQRSMAAAQECLAALASKTPLPAFHKQRTTLLPAVVAMVLAERVDLKVLDFGGGLGIGFMSCLESIALAASQLKYTIVELPEVSAHARSLLADYNIIYLDALPAGETFDIVHAASSVQYIEHYTDLLAQLCGYQAKYILLSDVFAGPIPTFATLQNYYGSRIPHWFLNLDELLNLMRVAGYNLILSTTATGTRLNAVDILPMTNFPARYRLSHSLHLLFRLTPTWDGTEPKTKYVFHASVPNS